MLLRVALMLCASCSAHRVRHSEGNELSPEARMPSEEDLRKAASASWKAPKVWVPTLDVKKYFFHQLELQRHSNLSIFEQTRSYMEDEDPRAWGGNWSRLGSLSVNFKNESGVDANGLRKEWLSLVMQSIVMPDGESGGLQCIKTGSCGEDAGAPQYLLKSLPSGELVPLSADQFEESEETGRLGSILKFAYDASEWAYEKVLGPRETIPYATSIRFKFLGKWLARAYIVSRFGYAPMGFHSLIYKSLVAGYVVAPENQLFYSQEDTIPACEKIAAIVQRRSPQELQGYGWLSCDEIKDPETGKYIQPSCYTPIYKDETMWEVLYTEWGSLAPDGAKADDLVPFNAARDFTERQCEESWKHFEEPVNYMVKGFEEVLPKDSSFWKVLNGNVEALQHLIEGSSEVDLEGLWEAVEWSGGWDDEEKSVLHEVLQELQKEGEGLPPVKRPLNKLLRFFTGSFKKPVEGWKEAKVEFYNTYESKCVPLIGKTCFNELRISSGCLEDPQRLKDMMEESIVSEDFAYE